MPQTLRHVSDKSILSGWDFSTSGVKCIAFDVRGDLIADVRLPTDLWTHGGVSELNLMQLEGQARASVRALAQRLREQGRLDDWVAGGISATHHTAGRIDTDHVQVRRAICWNDQTLAEFHEAGLKRLGGQKKVRALIGGPWAQRYSLSHLVKDETTLDEAAWQRTDRILSHGSLAAGYLTGNFDVASLSSASSTGILDLRSGRWCRAMLEALANAKYRQLAWEQLPRLIDQFEPVGPLSESLAGEARLTTRPLIFPTSDDQQAGLVGGGAVDAGQMAIILGSSAVVNSSSKELPKTNALDAMRLNWGPYLWMRCYTNGAQFVNHVIGADASWTSADWALLEHQARETPPGCEGTNVLPFLFAEPSLGVTSKRLVWDPAPPRQPGKKFRAALEALAFLIALGVRQHEKLGQKITRISVSGGMARSRLMCEILATALGRSLHPLKSDEGPALGAAVTALAGLENERRRRAGEAADYTVADAVAQMVQFQPQPIDPIVDWRADTSKAFKKFEKLLNQR
jgi:sugar (pentulose or hexulose) kinase